MNYEQCVHFLNNISKNGSKLGLESIFRLLRYLDNPQDKINVIHVAGTNGKGSVCNIIYTTLIESGYQVGMFNSPHIEIYNECIKANGLIIDNNDFALYTQQVIVACNLIVDEGYYHPTIFECLTAIALLYFSKKNLDFVIVETGLGGLNDATNVFSKPLLTIITSIDYDHMEYLGDSIEKIAFAKAGIIKENIPVIVGSNPENVINVIEKVATEKNSIVITIDTNKYYKKITPLTYKNNIILKGNEPLYYKTIIHSSSKEGISFSISSPYFSYVKLYTKLLGDHQLDNISIALTALSFLTKIKYNIPNNAIYNSLKNIVLECRCEYIDNPHPILFDGSHNHGGISALSDVIEEYFSEMDITLIFGALKDKEIMLMLKEILPIVDKLIITKPNNSRAMDTNELYQLASEEHSNIIIIEDKYQALDYSLLHRKENELICCAGSLYLSVPLRNYITK